MGDQVADDLSKGNFGNMKDLIGDSTDIGARLSKVLLDWLKLPRRDVGLGRKVLVELVRSTNTGVVEGFNFARATTTLTC